MTPLQWNQEKHLQRKLWQNTLIKRRQSVYLTYLVSGKVLIETKLRVYSSLFCSFFKFCNIEKVWKHMLVIGNNVNIKCWYWPKFTYWCIPSFGFTAQLWFKQISRTGTIHQAHGLMGIVIFTGKKLNFGSIWEEIESQNVCIFPNSINVLRITSH